MKKFERIGKSLSKEVQMQIMGGNSDIPEACIADGQDCAVFTACCNECLATFKCGTKKVQE